MALPKDAPQWVRDRALAESLADDVDELSDAEIEEITRETRGDPNRAAAETRAVIERALNAGRV